MSKFASLPGFRDFYPEDFAVRAHIIGVWREVAARYGFLEYDGPPLEPVELYTEKSGPEIVQQLYNFQDKGGRDVAMRPEMTPTLARMVGARAGGMRKPIKWFSVPQLFRYERAQRGRLREHFQLNLDMVGEGTVAADAEMLAAAIDVLRGFGLTADDFIARISDRQLLRALLLQAGASESALTLVYNIVDKLERESAENISRRLVEEAGLSSETARQVLAIFQHRDFEAVRQAYGGIEEISAEIGRMSELFTQLEAMELSDYVRFDLSVVRGLAYYTGVVFELFDARGELRAIAGGGRYDNLLQAVAGTDLPALGFGMGDVVLRELLSDRGLLPEVGSRIDFYLVAVTENERGDVMRLGHRLRDAGRSLEYGLRHQAVGKQLKAAGAVGARAAIIIGPDEVSAGEVVMRVLETGEESRIALSDLLGA
ncbi:histidine--tRNA ligase [soil metagenome]